MQPKWGQGSSISPKGHFIVMVHDTFRKRSLTHTNIIWRLFGNCFLNISFICLCAVQLFLKVICRYNTAVDQTTLWELRSKSNHKEQTWMRKMLHASKPRSSVTLLSDAPLWPSEQNQLPDSSVFQVGCVWNHRRWITQGAEIKNVISCYFFWHWLSCSSYFTLCVCVQI